MHLVASSNGQGGNAQHGSSGGQDVLVKSSSDVKVCPRSTIIIIVIILLLHTKALKLHSGRLYIYLLDAVTVRVKQSGHNALCVWRQQIIFDKINRT